MPGAIAILAVLVVFPVIVGMTSAGLAAVIGWALHRDGEARHEGSELVELNT